MPTHALVCRGDARPRSLKERTVAMRTARRMAALAGAVRSERRRACRGRRVRRGAGHVLHPRMRVRWPTVLIGAAMPRIFGPAPTRGAGHPVQMPGVGGGGRPRRAGATTSGRPYIRAVRRSPFIIHYSLLSGILQPCRNAIDAEQHRCFNRVVIGATRRGAQAAQ